VRYTDTRETFTILGIETDFEGSRKRRHGTSRKNGRFLTLNGDKSAIEKKMKNGEAENMGISE